MSKTLIHNASDTVHLLANVHLGEDSLGTHVVKIDDMVIDWATGCYRVTYVHPVTFIPTLVLWEMPQLALGGASKTVIAGGGGVISESYRLYVNRNIAGDTTLLQAHPNTAAIAIDSRLTFNGDNSYIKLFLGTDISDEGDVISAMISPQGKVISENIPLELVSRDNISNVSVKAPCVAHTLRTLEDGALVTLVVYSSTGCPTAIAYVKVKNTGFARQSNSPRPAITGIRLKSEYLSATDEKLLEYPINLPLDTMFCSCIVSYDDTSEREVLIDGNKVKLHGTEHYTPSIINQPLPLVLTYTLDKGEDCFAATAGGENFLSTTYDVVTIKQDNMYSVKLFVVPRWIDEMSGYMLEYWLLNLERDTVIDVTPLVNMGWAESRPFYPTTYGYAQDITASLELSDVSSAYKPGRHIQNFTITLLERGNKLESPWRIDYCGDGERAYGEDCFIMFKQTENSGWDMDLCGDSPDLINWLEKLYYKSYALFDTAVEKAALIPTHFRVTINNDILVYPIADWNVITKVTEIPKEFSTVKISFIHQTETEDLELAIAPVVVHHDAITATI